MRNREQVAWAFGFDEYDDRKVAQIVAAMLDAADVACLDRADKERLEKWLGLECDPETNDWGIFEEENE